MNLEPSAHDMQHLTAAAMAWLAPWAEALTDAPSRTFDPTAIPPIPDRPVPFGAVLQSLQDVIIHNSVSSAGPTYQAYIPGGGLFTAALGEFVAAVTNRYVGVHDMAPGPVAIETSVLRWFCDMVGYPSEARGIITSGGSLANFSAIVTARRTHLGDDLSNGTVYVSDQVHHSVTRAAMLAGIPVANVRTIPTDEHFQMRQDYLTDAIARDRRNHRKPFLLVASAGTTNTGAVDPLPALADIARRENLWFHVDAAYGGFFLLTERGSARLQGIEQADSITLDPHKGLFLPYGTGSLIVRQGHLLRKAHQLEADYLQDLDADAMNFADYSPELTRSFRGLRVWLPLQLHGVQAFTLCLDEKLDLIQYATERLKADSRLEVVAEPQLSVVAFRTRQGNDLDLLQRINATRKTFLSSTVLNGRPALRIAILCFRTHRIHVDRTLDAIAHA